MKKLNLLGALFVMFLSSNSYSAGIIILSGDTNIINPLEPGFATSSDNEQFFVNILQGGNDVAILENNFGYSDADITLNTFYNGIGGINSTIITGTVTDASLTNVDLFISPHPDNAFTTSEITALENYLDAGGSIFFLGEHDFYTAQNSWINSALLGLGSTLSIQPASLDPLTYHTAAGSQIAVDPFTSGVSSMLYVAASEVVGGKDLFFASTGESFIAYEVVPIPAAVWLFGSGLIGLVGLARRKKA